MFGGFSEPTIRLLRWFQKKKILQTDFEGEKLARIYLGKIISCSEKYIAHDLYNAEKFSNTVKGREKNLTPEVWEKSSYTNKITHTPLPYESQMVSHIGGGGRSGIDTIKKMAGAHSSCGGFPD